MVDTAESKQIALDDAYLKLRLHLYKILTVSNQSVTDKDFNSAILKELDPDALKADGFIWKNSGKDLFTCVYSFMDNELEVARIDLKYTLKWKSKQKTYNAHIVFDKEFREYYSGSSDIRNHFIKTAMKIRDVFVVEKDINAADVDDIKISYSYRQFYKPRC